MDTAIRAYLLSLGLNPIRIGYRYLAKLIEYGTLENIYPLKSVGYVNVGKYFNVSPQAIDKSIQNAISGLFKKGNIELLYKEFGNTINMNSGKPSNKHFVATIIDKLSYSS